MPNNPIHPANDPELVAIGDRLKELKERKFFGNLTIHMQEGIAVQLTTNETEKIIAPKQLLLSPEKPNRDTPGQLKLKPRSVT